MSKLATGLFAALLCASVARAASPTSAVPPQVQALISRDAEGVPGMEVTMSTVEYPPGGSSPSHSHAAQVLVYVISGRLIMQVHGGPKLTLGPGDTFYEKPTDVHAVSANASQTEPAKFVVFMLKKKTPAK